MYYFSDSDSVDKTAGVDSASISLVAFIFCLRSLDWEYHDCKFSATTSTHATPARAQVAVRAW